MDKVVVSRSIGYTFGPGQATGIDNVTVMCAVKVRNPLEGGETLEVVPITLQLPSAGWDEETVMAELQVKFPAFDISWEVIEIESAPESAPVAPAPEGGQ